MLKDLLVTTSLFVLFDSWILFFINIIFYGLLSLFDTFINNVVNSDDFISNSIDQDDNISKYKCNTLDDTFKAYNDYGFDRYKILNYTYKPIKKHIIYPIEYYFYKLDVIYIPQICDKVDLFLKQKCMLCVGYIWNFDCTQKMKTMIIYYIMYIIKECFKYMMNRSSLKLKKVEKLQ